MRNPAPKAAAIYCRISHDPSGERLGVQRQEDDCRAEATRRHWQITGIYVDDDRSAFSTRKPRPEYQRLLRDIQEGLVDGVLIWRLDRLHRQPRELEEFIPLTDKHQSGARYCHWGREPVHDQGKTSRPALRSTCASVGETGLEPATHGPPDPSLFLDSA
jgi:hypothetical protein